MKSLFLHIATLLTLATLLSSCSLLEGPEPEPDIRPGPRAFDCRIASLTIDGQLDREYQYDAEGRLTRANYYDETGNLSRFNLLQYPAGSMSANISTNYWIYDGGDTAIQKNEIIYDVRGNISRINRYIDTFLIKYYLYDVSAWGSTKIARREQYTAADQLEDYYTVDYVDSVGSSVSHHYSADNTLLYTENWTFDNMKGTFKSAVLFPNQHIHNRIGWERTYPDGTIDDNSYSSEMSYNTNGYPEQEIKTFRDGRIEVHDFSYTLCN